MDANDKVRIGRNTEQDEATEVEGHLRWKAVEADEGNDGGSVVEGHAKRRAVPEEATEDEPEVEGHGLGLPNRPIRQ